MTTTTTTRGRRLLRKPPDLAERSSAVLWFSCLVLSLALMGGTPRWALALLGVLGAGSCLFTLGTGQPRSPFAILALCLSAISLLQIVPLPHSWLERISPFAAEIWSSALGPGTPVPSFSSISIDRGASSAEALKWALYAAVLFVSTRVCARFGITRTLSIVYWQLTGLAAVTLLHALFDAQSVFGLYDPRYKATTWAFSPILNPNNLSSLMNLGIFLGFGLASGSRPSMETWAIRGTLPSLVAVALLSGSRAGVLLLIFGTALTLVFFLASKRRGSESRVGRAIGLALIVLGGVALAWLGPSTRLWENLTEESLEKFAILGWARAMIDDFWLTGIGAGAFETVFQRYRLSGGNRVWEHPENFLAAWLSEWGVIVGSFTVLAILWALRPRQLTKPKHPLVPYALIGVGAVVVQNLADVGFRTPAVLIMTCSVLGTLYSGGEFRPKFQDVRQPKRNLPLVPAAAATLILGSLLCLRLTGWETLDTERRNAKTLLEDTDFEDKSSTRRFFVRLRQAMARHPAEAYLVLIGAIGAEQAESDDALRWTAEALNRDPRNARTHLLLAQQLRKRGATKQALLELRLAVEFYEPNARIAAQLALAWTNDTSDLTRIVPEGKAGVPVLAELAAHVSADRLALKLSWLEKALQLDPDRRGIRRQIVSLLLTAMRAKTPPCTSSLVCTKLIREHLEHPSSQEGTEAELVSNLILESDLLVLEGKVDEALQHIVNHCPRHLRQCLMAWLQLATTNGRDTSEPARLLLDQDCIDDLRCADTHRGLAGALRTQGKHLQALSHLKEAASKDPSKDAWLSVARRARELGKKELEQTAEQQASRFR